MAGMMRKNHRIASVAFVILIIVLSGGLVYSVSTGTKDTVYGEVQEQLISVASVTASQIDGDALARIQSGDEDTADFIRIRDQLRRTKEATPNILYIYTMRRGGDAIEFVVDGDYGYAADAAPIGEPYPEAEPELFSVLPSRLPTPSLRPTSGGRCSRDLRRSGIVREMSWALSA